MANPRTIARLEAQIQRRAAHCLQFELADPRGSFITVTKVELAKDLSSGKIRYSVLGDEAERTRVEHMLEDAAGFIQRQIARVLSTRTVPHLRWVYDDSVEHAAHVDRLIQEALERDRRIDPDYDSNSGPEEDPDGGPEDAPEDDAGDSPESPAGSGPLPGIERPPAAPGTDL